MRVHERTETNGGRSAERPTRSRTGHGRIVKEEDKSPTSFDYH